jgi:hypothetical protein
MAEDSSHLKQASMLEFLDIKSLHQGWSIPTLKQTSMLEFKQL